MEDKKYDFSMLYDEAVAEDLFEDKTHEKVATTLCELVKSEDKGSTIALEGSWGSGKSVVISILEKKLNDVSENVLLFVFDAWAHEGDPLRRVFLESLIETIVKADKSIDADKLYGLSKTISNKEKIVRIKTKRTATRLARCLASSAFLVPLGVVAISLWRHDSVPSFIYLLICSMSIAPLFVLIARFIKLLIRKFYFKENINVWSGENWPLFEGDGTEETSQDVSDDTDRSSIEFEEYFARILEEYFKNEEKRKLVIVVDNLDRIDPDDSLRIWSTLQTFLQQRNISSFRSSWFDNIWLIVPFDPEGLSKIWNRNNLDEDEGSCAKSFFDKCFQLRLDVPTPILTGWEKFTQSMIEKAFPTWKIQEKRQIFEILKLTHNDMHEIPTPREIKNYINQVGLLRMHLDKAIPIESISYYVIYRYLKNEKFLINDLRDKLLGNIFPEQRHRQFLPKTCKKDFAGIIFGVSPDKGEQLLLDPKIAEALRDGNSKLLFDMESNHGEGFWAVFDRHIQRVTLDNALIFPYSQSIYNSLWKEHSDRCALFVNQVMKRVSGSEDIPWTNENNCDDYVCLIKLLENHKDAKENFREKLFNSLDGEIDKEPFDFSVNTLLLGKLMKNFNGELEVPVVLNSLNLEKLLIWSKAAHDEEIPSWKWVRPNDSVVSSISGKIVAGKAIPIGTKEAIDYSIRAGIAQELLSVATSCKSHIIWNNGTPTAKQHSPVVFDILLELAFNNEACFAEVVNILQNGICHNLIYHLRAEVLESASLLFAYCLRERIHSVSIPAVGNSAAGLNEIRSFWMNSSADKAGKVLCFLKKYDQWEFLWKMLEDKKSKLVVDILYAAASDQSIIQPFIVNNALNKFKSCCDSFGDDRDDDNVNVLLDKMIKNSGIEQEIVDFANLNIPEFDYELFILAQKTTDDNVIARLAKELKTIDAGIWLESFSLDTYLTSIALKIKERRKDFELQKAYCDAIFDFIKENKEVTEWQKDNWSKLVGLMGEDFQCHYKIKVTDHLLKLRLKVSSEFYKVNEAYFLLENIEKDVEALQLSVEQFIKDKDLERLGWMATLLSKIKFKSTKAFRNVIIEDFQHLYEENEDEEKKILIKQVAKYFNINIEEMTEDEDSGEEDSPVTT
ncbi:MAG: hypothetical protein KAR05_04020 [Candidatus Omnitrophica bacterium]|nr:hypothetical protein [Candidatus Omnitrophota bacterium]